LPVEEKAVAIANSEVKWSITDEEKGA